MDFTAGVHSKNNEASAAVSKQSDRVSKIKEILVDNLDEAYSLVAKSDASSEYLSVLGDILTKYGRVRYEDKYSACMVMMRASLNAQLAAIGVFNTLCFDMKSNENLSKLENTLFQHEQFLAFDDFLIKSDMDAIAAMIHEKDLSKEELTKMGYTLSWMANSLHHTQGFRTTEEDKSIEALNHRRFDQVYALCEKVLIMADNEKANLELAEMYYNGLRGVEFRKDPKNIEGAHQWLDKAMKLNPSLEMAARVANLKSGDYANAGDFEKAIGFVDKAFKIRQSFPKEQQDPFLVANLYSRKAGFLLKAGNLEEADQTINNAIEHSTACRIKGKNHQYFGIYDMTKAKIKLAQGEHKEALKYINSSLATFEYHEEDSADLIKMALATKEAIEKAITK